MSLATSYGFLILAVILGVTSNSFAKSAEGFTLLFPSVITGITIVACMYALSMVMKNIPMGITYASFAGLTIIATVIVGIIRFDTMEGLEGFKADDELHKERAAAGVDLANSVTTPMGDDLLEQYKG